MNRLYTLLVLLALGLSASAQRFFNLASEQVSVDSVLPHFSYTIPLPADYRDSIYTASIVYPEFIDMTPTDIANYHRLSADSLPTLPVVSQQMLYDRRSTMLNMNFCPLVYRDGKYQILVSFMLRVDAKPAAVAGKAKSVARVASASALSNAATTRATDASSRYAAHSVLRSGRWAKIRVPETGVYELTSAVARQAGFSDLSRVKIYGYGGNLQNEVLNGDELAAHDDLKEVPTCMVNGHRLFYARGPVSWSSNTAARRTRNPYSSYGYYFLTENDSTPASVDSTAFLNSFYPSADDYHSLYEVDGFSWYEGGRNLFDPEAINTNATKRLVITHPKGVSSAQLSVNVTAGQNARVSIAVNGSTLGTISVTLADLDAANERAATYQLSTLNATDTVKITTLAGGPVHLDYVSLAYDKPAPAPDLTQTFPAPEYVYNITNQDHHADAQADMVIIIPTSQKLLAQAERLAAYHRQHDSLRINIVPADELYNEFSSGTLDANAYRRYMKMLYDRAETDADLPRYLLLFGDGVWDNRMLTSGCRNLDPDDYLLCYESENSFNEVHCYVDDGFFGYLDDGEGVNLQNSYNSKPDMLDLGIGRFPVTTAADAKIMVDKAISYMDNDNAGAWQNVMMFMGDDGNSNLHMSDCNIAAEQVMAAHPGYQVKKVMWDAYAEEVTSTGNRYPDVSNIIKQQQKQGALIMDYSGHGRADWISHEAVLTLSDFQSFTNTNLPLWITASCDIMAFDGLVDNIGETAVLNANGGAVAFYGTTRTVYAYYNGLINRAFLRYVLSTENGKALTLGEAQRRAKNYLITSGGDLTDNKLQYTLLGDPALSLNLPQATVVIDSINGQPVSTTPVNLASGSVASIAGHVSGSSESTVQNDFNGTVSLQVLDSRELITCHMNPSARSDKGANTPFQFYNRTKNVYNGTDSIRGGRFSMQFVVPVDLNYDNATGLVCAYAVKADRSLSAHGSSEAFILGGSGTIGSDSIGPKIRCYLNSPDFQNGGNVNPTPYFVAQLSDDDGINATGNGIGHDLELIVDGEASRTYNLNDNFQFDFGSYTSGSTWYSIPALEPGHHSLLFRAWDNMNNASTATLDFTVVKGLVPTIFSVAASRNPATTSTSFIINHNFRGSDLYVIIDVFDMSGRLLWSHSEQGTSDTNNYTIDWNLTTGDGKRLQTGVYLYRARVSSDGSAAASKAKKLIIINNN